MQNGIIARFRSLPMSRSAGLVGLSVFFSSRRRHTRLQGDWSSDVCSSDLGVCAGDGGQRRPRPKIVSCFDRSEEHTSELQSPCNLVCRLLLEKKQSLIYLVCSFILAFSCCMCCSGFVLP